MPHLIHLIGYRGSGKSAVARVLAERLGWDWLDADTELERRQARSIRQIFAAGGEPVFRDLEATLFAELCGLQQHVLALGGGLILREENRSLLRMPGHYVVWLTADAATLWQRMQQDTSTTERRPDLSVGGLAEIEEMLERRRPLYAACADRMVETAGRSPEEIAEEIAAPARCGRLRLSGEGR
jgi:shikimate kinase